MIKNYLKIAWRNLTTKKVISLINIGGLAVGMAVTMMIGLWIWDEISFDKSFPDHNNIARIMQNVTNNGEKQTWPSVPFPLADELRKKYASDFKYVALSSDAQSQILSFNDKKLSESGNYMEPKAAEILSLTMLRGNRNSLNDPSSILLSESTAKAYFGDADPINKLMKIDNMIVVKVTGVYMDMPYNSSFADMNFIAPWEIYLHRYNLQNFPNPWRINGFYLYVQTVGNADMDKLSLKIKDVKLRNVHADERIHKPQLFLHPMGKWHLNAEFKDGINTGGRIQYVWLFGIIGVFVLLLACINFMNLSTARAEKRAKEVGVRKAVGSLRGQLIKQFFIESIMVALVAFILCIGLVQLTLPLFNEIADKRMVILWDNPVFWLGGISFTLITGFIAGSYPAFYLSSFSPIKALRGSFRLGRLASVPRKILIVLQFSVSIVLIIGTIVIFRQIQYARNRPVGYNRNGLAILHMNTSDIHDHFAVVKDELLKKGAITSIAECESATTDIFKSNIGFDWKGKDPGLSVSFPNTAVSQEYGKTVEWGFIQGRDFSTQFLSDSSAFVINQTAAEYMGLKNPIGEIVKLNGVPFHVIGVIKDMVQESPYTSVRPSFFHLATGPQHYTVIKLNPKISALEGVNKIEAVYKIYDPSEPFEYKFADEEYDKKFGNEERIGKLASAFAGLAIFISCLGLFGMASFMAEQRIKEIGVRKVLGASVFNLWSLLSKDFVMLVIISLIIATPIAYYFMNRWLQNYQYHPPIAWWIFGVTGIGAMAVTLLTVSYQSIKAAFANPVKSLKTE